LGIKTCSVNAAFELNATLTDGGDHIQETLLGEQRVFQPSEIQLKNTCH